MKDFPHAGNAHACCLAGDEEVGREEDDGVEDADKEEEEDGVVEDAGDMALSAFAFSAYAGLSIRVDDGGGRRTSPLHIVGGSSYVKCALAGRVDGNEGGSSVLVASLCAFLRERARGRDDSFPPRPPPPPRALFGHSGAAPALPLCLLAADNRSALPLLAPLAPRRGASALVLSSLTISSPSSSPGMRTLSPRAGLGALDDAPEPDPDDGDVDALSSVDAAGDDDDAKDSDDAGSHRFSALLGAASNFFRPNNLGSRCTLDRYGDSDGEPGRDGREGTDREEEREGNTEY